MIQSLGNGPARTPITHIVIVDQILNIVQPAKGRLLLTPDAYISGGYREHYRLTRRTFVINLCNQYNYLKTGYYCSLLADARDQFCVPAISDVVHAHWKRIHAGRFHELEATLNDPLTLKALKGCTELDIFFGRTEDKELESFGRQVFDAFRLPCVKVMLGQKRDQFIIKSITPLSMRDVFDHADIFNQALNEFTGAKWDKSRKSEKTEKYWLAILHDPDEEFAPSNREALANFQRVGKTMGFYVELITKLDFNSLLEFDALFIRETTAVNSHTYRFAEKAAREGLAVIDDPMSILRCCNKVYLQEMFAKHKIPAPKGAFLYKHHRQLPQLGATAFPKILKIPDGSFSRGVFKVQTQKDFEQRLHEMFAKSEMVLMQDFVQSDFDWRIVVLNGRALFACKYFMAKSHWQIYNHSKPEDDDGTGDVACIAVEDVPENVMETALAACAIVGDGLYGVDLKEVNGKVYVIEINDNPNIDAGFEDQLLGDELYRAVFDHFKTMIDAE